MANTAETQLDLRRGPGPTGTVFEWAHVVVTVNVLVPAALSTEGLSEQLASVRAADSEHVRLMLPLKPLEGATVMVAIPDCPGADTLRVPALMAKSSTETASEFDVDSSQSGSPEYSAVM